MIEVFKVLIVAKIISGRKKEEVKKIEKKGCYCLFHQDFVNHIIQDCSNFLNLVQRMIDDREIEFCIKVERNMEAVTQ